jgi:hypothetical protein
MRHRLAGRVRQPYARVDYIPQSGTKNLAKAFVSDYNKEKSAGYVVFVFFPIKAVAWLCRQTKHTLLHVQIVQILRYRVHIGVEMK